MILLAVRGLVARRGRTLMATVGIALVSSIAFVLAGVTAGFSAEVNRTLDALKGDFAIPVETTGLLTGLVPEEIGPDGSEPILFARDVAPRGDLDLNLFGFDDPKVSLTAGHGDLRNGEIIIDEAAGLTVGDSIMLAGKSLEVIGTTSGVRLYAGGPVAFMTLDDMQQLYFSNRDVARAFANAPSTGTTLGLRELSRVEAESDLERPVRGAVASLVMTRTLLWIMVAGIVFSIGQLSVLDRWRELAALRCIGASFRSVAVTLLVEGLLLGVLGAAMGWFVGLALEPLFPLSVESSLGTGLWLVGLGAIVAVISALLGSLRLRSVSPQDAFRSFG